MKTIFDQQTRAELVSRINKLDESSKPKWGSMTVYQMIKHCTLWEEMLLGRTLYKQTFLGRIFGKIALKDLLKDKPMKPNMPTVPSFKITGNGDVEAAKLVWINLINEHTQRKEIGFFHPFFGQLSAEQAGRLAYKHIEHHLQQFNT